MYFIVLWICCTLSGLTLCLITLRKNTADFLDYKVETLVEIKYDNDADFPTVTFCTIQVCDLPDFNYEDSLCYYYFNV